MLRLILIVVFVLAFLVIRFVPWQVTLIVGISLILLSKFFFSRLLIWLFSIPFRAKGRVLRGATVEVHSVRPAAPPPDELVESRGLIANQIEPIGANQNSVDSDSSNSNTDWIEHEADADDEEPDVPRDYYEVEVTITPRPQPGPFFYWDYDDVSLVMPHKRWHEDDDCCRVESVTLVQNPVIVGNRVQSVPERDDPHDNLEVVSEDEDRDDGSDDDGSDDDGSGGKVVGPRRLRMLIGVQEGVRQLVFNYYFEKFGKLELPPADHRF